MKFGYCMPAASAYYLSPPYFYKNNNGINIVFRTTPEVLHDLLPPRLNPKPDNLAFFYAGDFNVEAPVKVKYKEAGIGIPVLFEGKAGNYFVYLYLDLAAAIVPGREIWGWPKKDAAISYSSEMGVYQASVKRDGIEIIHATVNASKKVKPIPNQDNVPSFNLKIIPSVRKDQLPDVLQLTSAGGSSTRKELFMGEATLSLASSPSDKLGNIPMLEIVHGAQYIDDMSLDCGEVLIDYLAENQQ
jgi:acetoacetate decarboxylase